MSNLDTIRELVTLHKKFISEEKSNSVYSAELELPLLSLVGDQVQEQRSSLIQSDVNSFKRFELALAEHISNLKARVQPDAQITLKQYKESTSHQDLTDSIHHYYGRLYIACNRNTQDSQQKANELLVSQDKLDGVDKRLIILQDTNSLHKVSSCIELALTESNRGLQEDELILKRTLQIIGEYLKDSEETSNLSREINQALSDAGIPMSDLAQLRNTMSHSSALFTLPEMGENDKNELIKGFESIKSIIDEHTSQIEYKFIKDLANEAKNAYKGADTAIKGKLEEIVNTSDLDEINRLREEVSEMISDGDNDKKVKTLLDDIHINITEAKIGPTTSELYSIFRVPGNPEIDKLFGEIVRKRVTIEESYEKLYAELLVNLQDVSTNPDLHAKLSKEQEIIRAKYTLTSFFAGEINLNEREYKDNLEKIPSTDPAIKKLNKLFKAEELSESNVSRDESYADFGSITKDSLIALLKKDSYFQFIQAQEPNLSEMQLKQTIFSLLDRFKNAEIQPISQDFQQKLEKDIPTNISNRQRKDIVTKVLQKLTSKGSIENLLAPLPNEKKQIISRLFQETKKEVQKISEKFDKVKKELHDISVLCSSAGLVKEKLDLVLKRIQALDNELYVKVKNELSSMEVDRKTREELIQFFSQNQQITDKEYQSLIDKLNIGEEDTDKLLSYSKCWRKNKCKNLLNAIPLTSLEQLYRSIIGMEEMQSISDISQQLKDFVASFNLSIGTTSIEQQFTDKIKKHYLNHLKEKLELLKKLSENSEVNSAAIEHLLLDIQNIIIERLDPAMESKLKLARNYLAHGNPIIDAIYPDIHKRIILQAKAICDGIDFEKDGDDFLESITHNLSANPLLPNAPGSSRDGIIRDIALNAVKANGSETLDYCFSMGVNIDQRLPNIHTNVGSLTHTLKTLSELSELLEKADPEVISILIKEKYLDLKRIAGQLASLISKKYDCYWSDQSRDNEDLWFDRDLAPSSRCAEAYFFILGSLLEKDCLSPEQVLPCLLSCEDIAHPSIIAAVAENGFNKYTGGAVLKLCQLLVNVVSKDPSCSLQITKGLGKAEYDNLNFYDRINRAFKRHQPKADSDLMKALTLLKQSSLISHKSSFSGKLTNVINFLYSPIEFIANGFHRNSEEWLSKTLAQGADKKEIDIKILKPEITLAYLKKVQRFNEVVKAKATEYERFLYASSSPKHKKGDRSLKEQKRSGGIFSKFLQGLAQNLAHGESRASASRAQKDHDDEATRGGAQYEPQEGQASAEQIHTFSAVSSKDGKKKSEVRISNKPERSEVSKPTASQPEPATQSQSQSRSFIGTALPGFHDQGNLPSSYTHGLRKVPLRGKDPNK